MKRTHTCGELREKNIGETVVLCGWVHSRRDHGKLVFIDLRDREGITQVVFNLKALESYQSQINLLRSEYVVAIQGEVRTRPKGTVNPKLQTGQVEVEALTLEILNASLTPPFVIEDEIEISEDVRFVYRYLDLRRPKMLKSLTVRHRTYKIIRDFLDREGFVEVETPILTKSTPEGARDFLVPSRLAPGRFYALPQSPQLFKQLLMVAGLERYFQIAKCFRDEDLRADRQPEFTQLDLEMAFTDEATIFSITERLIVEIFKQTLGLELAIPFPRVSYHEAMKQYGTDKPDMRKKTDEFAFLWVVDFPLFKYNSEERRWEAEHHPFTAPKEEDISRLTDDPGSIRSRAYDLVVNGIEIGSGSIRIHKRELQEKIFDIIGLSEREVETRFKFLLEAFTYGAPPHGGNAIGLDRLVALLVGTESIREVIAFPKTQKGVCSLTGAPTEVSDRQLKELNLTLRKSDRS